MAVFSCKNITKEEIKNNSLENRNDTIAVKKDNKKNLISKEAKFLKSFYAAYVKELDNVPINFANVDSIKLKYCTSEFLDKLSRYDLDYDPLLDAQDVDVDILESLKIRIDSTINSNKKFFIITYDAGFQGDNPTIKLNLLNVENSFKISDITLD